MTQQNERVLVKDDSDLFQLIRQLTGEQPPVEFWETKHPVEPVIQIELPLSILLDAVDRLPVDEADLLYRRLEDRLVRVRRI